MLDFGYPYSEAFQERLLALLVQDPGATSPIIEPQYFGSPILEDIARVVTDCHKKHPGASLSYTFLKEAVEASLSRSARLNWSTGLTTKQVIKRAFNSRLRDKPGSAVRKIL